MCNYCNDNNRTYNVCDCRQKEYQVMPFCANINKSAQANCFFRKEFWTGEHLQMTLMCIPSGGEVGMECHPDTDQYIRVESGRAVVCMGKCRDRIEKRMCLCRGDAVFIPAGTWHNIVNADCCPLKLSSIYAPPHHPRGTCQCTKAEADCSEEYNK